MLTPHEALLHQIELCKMLETGEEFSPKTRKGAADLRVRLETRLAEEFQNNHTEPGNRPTV